MMAGPFGIQMLVSFNFGLAENLCPTCLQTSVPFGGASSGSESASCGHTNSC